jgi:hypothetical protein
MEEVVLAENSILAPDSCDEREREGEYQRSSPGDLLRYCYISASSSLHEGGTIEVARLGVLS